MLRKSLLLAVAATAALGFAVFNPNSAEAKGHGGGGMHGGGHGGGMHRGGGGHHGRGHHGHHGHHHHHRHRHWHVRWHRPVWYGYGYSYAARPAVAGPCTCLSKEYTPEGSVLFKDRCTNEMAMNPPPQQTGALDQQQPQGAYQQQAVQPQPQNMQPQVSYPPQAAR
jgi:hypothetical protein